MTAHQVQLRGFTANPAASGRGGRYHYFTLGVGALRPNQSRASVTVVHLTERRVRQLLSHEEMGDRKPSQFLQHLKSLAPDVPDDFQRKIWAKRLPPHFQATPVGQTEGSLDSTSRLRRHILRCFSPAYQGQLLPSSV